MPGRYYDRDAPDRPPRQMVKNQYSQQQMESHFDFDADMVLAIEGIVHGWPDSTDAVCVLQGVDVFVKQADVSQLVGIPHA